MDSIASRLKAARLEKGWTQEQLAQAATVSQGTVGNIEAGVRRSHGSLPRLAEALGVPHNWLRDGGDAPAVVGKDQTNPIDGAQAMRTAINTLATFLLDMDAESRKEAAHLMQELAENPAGRWAGRLGDLIEKESITRIGESNGISDRQGKYPLSTTLTKPKIAPRTSTHQSDAVKKSADPTGPKNAEGGSDREKDEAGGGGTPAGFG